MVKAEVKVANKRKSIATETPLKKAKIENGNETLKTSPKKQQPIKKGKQQNGAQATTKPAVKSENTKKPFEGTKQLDKKPKKQNENKTEGKKRRHSLFAALSEEVRNKQGTKDPEVLKKLVDRITAIEARGELSKTSKKKLGILKKFKQVVEEGQETVTKNTKERVLAEQIAKKKKQDAKKEQKPKAATKKEVPAKKQVAVKKTEEEDDDDDDEEEEEEDSDAEDQEADSDEEDAENDAEEESEEEDDAEESEEEAPAPKVSIKKGRPNKKK